MGYGDLVHDGYGADSQGVYYIGNRNANQQIADCKEVADRTRAETEQKAQERDSFFLNCG